MLNNDYQCVLDLINVLSYIIGVENLKKNDEQINALEKHLNEQDKQYEQIINLLKELEYGRRKEVGIGNNMQKD